MNARQHVRRKKKITAADVRRMARRAAARRAEAGDFVIGGFALMRGAVVLLAVAEGPARTVEARLSPLAREWSRWRTKQAAWSWLQLRPYLDLRVIHLGRLDVLRPDQRGPLENPQPGCTFPALSLEVDRGSTGPAAVSCIDHKSTPLAVRRTG